MTSISPAAEAALAEHLDGLRRRVLADAVQVARQQDEEVVTAAIVLQVVRALTDSPEVSPTRLEIRPAVARRLFRRKQLFQRLALSYILVGLTALVTAGLFEYVRRDGEVTPPIVLAVAGLIATLLGALAAFYGNSMFRQREMALRDSYEYGLSSPPLLESWAKFEGVLRTSDSLTLSDALRLQNDRGALTDSDLREVRDILRLRNNVVHGGMQPPLQEAEAAVARLNELTRRLEARPDDPIDDGATDQLHR